MTLGNRIRNLRREKGVSQEELASALGVSRQAVSKWENDLTSPDTENLISLSALLGVELSALVSDGQQPESNEGITPRKEHRFPWEMVLAACFLCLAVLFYTLWQVERDREEKLELLCHASAVSCLDSLQEYDKTLEKSHFLSATAEFRAFMQAYHLLTEESSKHGNYTYLSEAYGYMLCNREKIEVNLALLISAMERLSADIFDYLGHDLMYDLYVKLRHG